MKKHLLTLSALALLLASCGGSSSSPKSADSTKKGTTTASVTDTTKKASASPETAWKYEQEEDKMSSAKKYFAQVEAKDKIDFAFPYNGGSTATLGIRNMDHANNIYLTVSKGQFNTHTDGQTVKVRFDDDKPEQYNFESASSGSNNVIFIKSEDKFIKRLLTAKKVLIQAEFFEHGNEVMEFNVAGFKWDHKSA